MTDNRPGGHGERGRSIPTDRESPVGAPVIRGDESVTGTRARQAVQFDPDDPDSLEEAAKTVAEFASGASDDDHLYMLRRGSLCRTRSRRRIVQGRCRACRRRRDGLVHPQMGARTRSSAVGPQAGRARENRAHSGETHRPRRRRGTTVARVGFDRRRSHRSGGPKHREFAQRRHTDPRGAGRVRRQTGELELTLSPPTYRDLRRRASIEDVEPGEIVTEALETYFEDCPPEGTPGTSAERERKRLTTAHRYVTVQGR